MSGRIDTRAMRLLSGDFARLGFYIRFYVCAAVCIWWLGHSPPWPPRIRSPKTRVWTSDLNTKRKKKEEVGNEGPATCWGFCRRKTAKEEAAVMAAMMTLDAVVILIMRLRPLPQRCGFTIAGIHQHRLQYTFILTATKELPKQCIMFGTPTAKLKSRKDVGVRMPDDAICQAILEKMDSPLISTSCKCPRENEWILDPVAIADTYGPEGLDFVIDGGVRLADPSTVVDMTIFPPKIIRQGKGPQLHWMVAEGDHDDDDIHQ